MGNLTGRTDGVRLRTLHFFPMSPQWAKDDLGVEGLDAAKPVLISDRAYYLSL